MSSGARLPSSGQSCSHTVWIIYYEFMMVVCSRKKGLKMGSHFVSRKPLIRLVRLICLKMEAFWSFFYFQRWRQCAKLKTYKNSREIHYRTIQETQRHLGNARQSLELINQTLPSNIRYGTPFKWSFHRQSPLET